MSNKCFELFIIPDFSDFVVNGVELKKKVYKKYGLFRTSDCS